LVADIHRQIQDGTLRVNDYLLPERELAKKYNVSSRAVREGLAHLEAKSLIRRHQGRGTIVLRGQTPEGGAKLKNVAVIFQGRVRDASTAEEFDGFQQAFQAEGYGTTLYVADSQPRKEAQIVERLVGDGVPGLVLFSNHPSDSDAHLRAARKAGMKIVTFDHDFPTLDCNFVGIDDRLAAFEAAEHLIRLGCRQLLLINSERDWTTHVLRQQGFEEAAKKWGLPWETIGIPTYHTAPQFSDGIGQKLLPVMRQAARPLGIVAWWDEAALRAIENLRRAGWAVPDDAAVVGFANDLKGELAEIPLTTMEIPRHEITAVAAALLVNQMRDPTRPSQKIRLKARMIIRESCGTYRRRGGKSDLGKSQWKLSVPLDPVQSEQNGAIHVI
jgi:DNA-binding LacI/PurR family transcriptional regulator